MDPLISPSPKIFTAPEERPAADGGGGGPHAGPLQPGPRRAWCVPCVIKGLRVMLKCLPLYLIPTSMRTSVSLETTRPLSHPTIHPSIPTRPTRHQLAGRHGAGGLPGLGHGGLRRGRQGPPHLLLLQHLHAQAGELRSGPVGGLAWMYFIGLLIERCGVPCL